MSPWTAAAGPASSNRTSQYQRKRILLLRCAADGPDPEDGPVNAHASSFGFPCCCQSTCLSVNGFPGSYRTRDSPAPTDIRLSFQLEAQIWGQVSGLRTCPFLLRHAVRTGSVRYASGRSVAQVPHAAVSGLAVEAMKASVMGQLLVESWHAPVRRAFLRASVAGGGEPVFRRKIGRLIKFRHLQQVCTRTTILNS